MAYRRSSQAQQTFGTPQAGVTGNDGWFTVDGVPGMPILTMDFVPVPDGKF